MADLRFPATVEDHGSICRYYFECLPTINPLIGLRQDIVVGSRLGKEGDVGDRDMQVGHHCGMRK